MTLTCTEVGAQPCFPCSDPPPPPASFAVPPDPIVVSVVADVVAACCLLLAAGARVHQLTASVSEKGRELSRVWEWNEEYGEVKKKRPDASAHHLSMYL